MWSLLTVNSFGHSAIKVIVEVLLFTTTLTSISRKLQEFSPFLSAATSEILLYPLTCKLVIENMRQRLRYFLPAITEPRISKVWIFTVQILAPGSFCIMTAAAACVLCISKESTFTPPLPFPAFCPPSDDDGAVICEDRPPRGSKL